MKKINWLDHFSNLLVVILGITIAFYLESYKEESSNQIQEEKYLESLIKDLETDVEALDTLLIINDNIIKALVGLTNASIGVAQLSDSALITSMFAIQYNPPFTPQRTTYESLKSSGQMELIQSFELRNEVVELYEQFYRGSGEYDVAINEHVRDFVKPFFMKNVKFKAAYVLDDAFLRDGEFQNITFAYRYLFISKNDFYKKMLENTRKLSERIQAYQANLDV